MPLVLEGLRRRLGLAVVAFVCATVVVASSVLGAVFAVAASESDLRDVLNGAPLRTEVRFQMRSHGGSEQLTPAEGEASLDSGAARLRSRYLARPVAALYTAARPIGVAAFATSGRPGPDAPVVFRSDSCAHLRLVRGRCPVGPDEAVVSVQSAALPYGYALGRPLIVGFDGAGTAVTVQVVGLYVPRDSSDPYWGGPQYFDSSVSGTAASLPAVFVDRSFFARLDDDTAVRASLDRQVLTDRVLLGDLPALQRTVQGFRAWSRGHGDAFTTDTDLAAVLRQAAGRRAAIDAAAALVVLQLCVLGWVTLFRILQEFIGSRDAEVVLAKLRGYRLAALLRFTAAESLTLLLLAAPAGLLAGWWLAGRLADGLLLPGTPVVLPPAAVLAALVAVAGGVVAVVVSAMLLLRRSVGQQARRTRQTAGPARAPAVLEGAVVVVASAAFVVIRATGTGGGLLTLLAPGLLVVAVGTVAARVLPLLLAPVVRLTAHRRRVAVLLAVRQVVRRPAGCRLVSLLTVSVGLAVFGVSGEAMAAENRDARAAVETGAEAVQRITVATGEDPVAEVRRADPGGRWAAAAARWLSFGGTDLPGTLLAVDADRLPAVTPVVPGIQDPAALAREVRGPVRPVVLRGRRVQVQAALSGLRGDPPTLLLELQGHDAGEVEVELGALRPGRRTYSATIPCAQRCSLTGVSLYTVGSRPSSTGLLLVQRVAVDGTDVDATLTSPAAWRARTPLGAASDRVHVDGRGVADRFVLGQGGTGGVVQNGLPDPVPAVATPAGASRSAVGSRLTVTSSDDTTATLRVAAKGAVLPIVVGDGVLADASAFRAALPTFVPDATWSVLLGPRAPADARARLERAGLLLDGRPATLPARRAALAREGPALALLLLQAMGIAGVLCAVSGVVVSIRSVLRRRSYEGAALLTVGVTRRQLVQAILLEQVLLLGSAVVFGVPVGLLAVVTTMPALQQSDTASAVPQAVLPPAAPVLLLVAVLVALVVLAVGISAGSVVRAARGGRLREGED
ncbi:ABC transporter permease [Amnibacterium kyonggiense]